MQRLDVENLMSKDGGETICVLAVTEPGAPSVGSATELVSPVLQTNHSQV